MCGSIARQPTRPVESSRPQRLAANTENGRQLRMCRGAWIAVSEREKSAHQDVPGRGPAGEFLRCVRARAQLQEQLGLSFIKSAKPCRTAIGSLINVINLVVIPTLLSAPTFTK